ncbi:RDD family protein [Lysobacter sp. P5_B9]
MDPYNTAGAHVPGQPPAIPPANPYAAPAARIAEAYGDVDFVTSSRGARLGAVMLDGLIVAVPAMLVAMIVPALGSGPNGRGSAAMAVLFALLGIGFIAFMAVQLVLLHRHGQTMGKKLVGIRIVRSDGSRAGLGRIFLLRSLVPGLIGAIPLLGPIFGLIDPLFIFGSDKRCLHDLIADTIVVDA